MNDHKKFDEEKFCFNAHPTTKPSAALPAGKHFDIVVGVDIHFVKIPPSLMFPLPHPHVGIIFDPIDYLPPISIPVPRALIQGMQMVMPVVDMLTSNLFGPGQSSSPHMAGNALEEAAPDAVAPLPAFVMIPIGIGTTVRVNGMCRSQVSTNSKILPCHIPMGPGFSLPPFAKSVGSSFMGSARVLVEGMPFTYTGLPFLSCSDIGMPYIQPPVFKGGISIPPKPKKPILYLPTAIVSCIPMGRPVNVGGPPTIFMSIMDAVFGGLKIFKKFKGKKASQFLNNKYNKKGNSFVSTVICWITGHPVDVCDGKFFTDWVDFELKGQIPIKWERTYYSSSKYDGPIGHGWHHNYDINIEDDPEFGNMLLQNHEGRHINVPRLEIGELYYDRKEHFYFYRDEGGYLLRLDSGVKWRFGDKENNFYKLKSMFTDGGHSINFEYSNGNLSKIIDTAGRVINIVSDENNRISEVYGPDPDEEGKENLWVRYEYDKEGRLVRTFDALEQVMKFEYKGNLMVKETWADGLNFYFTYEGTDHNARCIHTWGDDGIYNHKLYYDDKKGKTTVVNSLGEETVYHHKDGLPWKVVAPNGGESLYHYNEYQELLKETDALDRETNYTFDTNGNETGIIRPSGGKSSVTFDDLNRPINALDVNGGVWMWEYDEYDQLKTTATPADTINYEYENGVPVKVSERGVTTEIEWDDQLNPISFAAEGGKEYNKFDRLGRLKTRTDSRMNNWHYKYDLLDRVTNVIEADGANIDLEYDAQNNVTYFNNGRRSAYYEYSGMGKIISKEEKGRRVEFKYNTEEDLIGIKDERGSKYSFRIDPMGQVMTEIGYDGLTKKYDRDLLGRVMRIRKPGDVITRYQYDNGDRVNLVKHEDGTSESFVYREDGRILEAANEQAVVQFEYDQRGKLFLEKSNGFEVQSFYNAKEERISIKTNLGANIDLKRDKYGGVTGIDAQQNAEGIWKARILRDNLGLEVAKVSTGGVRSRWKRDRLGNPLSQTVDNIGSRQVTYSERKYQWSSSTRLTGVSDIKRGISVNYFHDPFDNLIGAKYSDGSTDIRHADETGNLYKTTNKSDRKYGKAGEVLECEDYTYKYNAEGYLIEKKHKREIFEKWQYLWNASGMLEQVLLPDEEKVAFEYDALGRRIAKHYKNETTRWVWDGNTPIHEWTEVNDAANSAIAINEEGNLNIQIPKNLVTWIFEDDGYTLAAKLQNGKQYSIICNHMGVPYMSIDEKGYLNWSAELDIYGKPRDVIGDSNFMPFRFPGQYEDRETGLYYNRFRYYDPEVGAYISQDPIGLAGGNPNIYGYVADVNGWIDVFGLANNKTYKWRRFQNKYASKFDDLKRKFGETIARSFRRKAWKEKLRIDQITRKAKQAAIRKRRAGNRNGGQGDHIMTDELIGEFAHKQSYLKKFEGKMNTGVYTHGTEGFKSPTGVLKLTQQTWLDKGYTHKIKIKGKGGAGDYRVWGKLQENGDIIFDTWTKGVH